MMVMAIIFSLPQQPAQPPPDPQLINILTAVDALGLVTAIPIFAFIRHNLFKRARVDGVLPPQTYATGNIIFWAGCEGVSFFGLVIALLHRSFWPTILIVGAAIAIQVLTFPRAQALARPDDTFKIG